MGGRTWETFSPDCDKITHVLAGAAGLLLCAGGRGRGVARGQDEGGEGHVLDSTCITAGSSQ